MVSRFRPGPLGSPVGRRMLVGLLVILLIVIALIPRQTQFLLKSFGQPVADLVAFPMEGLAALDRGIRHMWNHYLALQGVHEQNLALQQEMDKLQGQLNQLREQVLASERLAALLDFQKETDMQTVVARVLGRNPSNWYRALIVDKGEQDGVEEEMGVMTPGGVVGQIVKTHSTTSIVLLLTDPNVAVTGLVQTSRDEGIVQGGASGQVRMKYLPPLSAVQPGDVVVTSGLTGGFPRGLLIGTIEAVREEEGELFKSAVLSPTVDFGKLEEVLIIQSPQPVDPLEILQQSLPAGVDPLVDQ